MGDAVVHFEIAGRDGKKLESFYHSIFGWDIDSKNPMSYGYVKTGATSGINGGIREEPAGPAGVTFYIQVADLQKTLDQVQRLGGRTLIPPK
jgi:predicted enzyme related to lactoylglutathione lyase